MEKDSEEYLPALDSLCLEEIDATFNDVDLPIPTPSSGSTSPILAESPSTLSALQAKKKKKKKSKKSAKAKAHALEKTVESKEVVISRPPILCISRNKHWKYISSYHGPWLQLPLELLESLLVINLDPATMAPDDSRVPSISSPPSTINRLRERRFTRSSNFPPQEISDNAQTSFSVAPPFPSPEPGKASPPPIDPGVFRSVTSIRRLIDEASELSVRATSGLSAAALGSIRSPTPGVSLNNNPWAAAQTFGINPLGDPGGGGRNVVMSSTRIHRLRVLAVQKLAAAYRADEIASSVMVMQGGSVFEEIAEKVLKIEPNNVDARYVHFFHEKIPSRQLAESTTTELLDQLISANPQRLEFFRTRGIVHCFRDEYVLAVKDFTHALKETRALRRARAVHNSHNTPAETRPKNRKKKGKINGQAPPSGTAPFVEGTDGEQLLVHPSVLADAPEPIEHQLLFHRGAAYLQHALYSIEQTIMELEGISKLMSHDGGELRLCYLEQGKYGGTEIGNPDGPLGRRDGSKSRAYRSVLSDIAFREHICSLLRKSVRDHEKFLSHFDTLENTEQEKGELGHQVEHAFLLSEFHRPGNHNNNSSVSDMALAFTTYHPLLVESHFSILICLLLLGDFHALAKTFVRTAFLVAGLEGYPVFLPPRSMAQAEFIETLERLAAGWKYGVQATSFSDKAPVRDFRPRLPSPIQSATDEDQSDINGPSSSAGPSLISSAAPSASGRGSPINYAGRIDLEEALDCLRVLLAPVATRQKQKAEKAATEKSLDRKKPISINIPLHGPRVEVFLAWLAAVHLPELEEVA